MSGEKCTAQDVMAEQALVLKLMVFAEEAGVAGDRLLVLAAYARWSMMNAQHDGGDVLVQKTLKKNMGRTPVYASSAERQTAYRERKKAGKIK